MEILAVLLGGAALGGLVAGLVVLVEWLAGRDQ